MVQEFHVVRCFSCQSFQVQQVKKAVRWSCKLCGEKQSLLKEFGRGSAADCRCHVQKLNAMRGAMMEEQERNTWSLWKQVEADGEEEPDEQGDIKVTHSQVSCWNKYLDTSEETGSEKEEEGNVLMKSQQLHGNNMIDRKRKRREGQTPKQSKWPSLMNLGPTNTKPTSPMNLGPSNTKPTSPMNLGPSNTKPTSPMKSEPATTKPTSLNGTSAPCLMKPGAANTKPTSLNETSAPSARAGPVSRWACFLSSDHQVTEDRSLQSVGGVNQQHCLLMRSPTRPRPLLPVSSMFQSSEEFSFDEFLS